MTASSGPLRLVRGPWPALPFALLLAAGLGHAQAPEGGPPVDVATPLIETIIDYDIYTGRFVARESVTLQARVSGYLASIHFEDGQLVERGDLLYEIDRRPFELALTQAQARLEAAEAVRDLSEIELNRAQELVRRNVGAQSDADSAVAQFGQAQANIAIAVADIDAAELDLEFTRIMAPITGRISATDIDVGNLVVGGPSGATVLSNIVSVDPIEFEFTVSEADYLKYARLYRNDARPTARATAIPISVRLMDENDWSREGHMTFVDNQLDPNSGTLLGRALLENPDEFLQPGVFGRLRLPGSGEYEAALIPDTAIVADQSQSIVYVVGEDDIVEQRRVEPGPIWRGLRVVRSGVEAGDRIVISGVQRARPGSPVTPRQVEVSLDEMN